MRLSLPSTRAVTRGLLLTAGYLLAFAVISVIANLWMTRDYASGTAPGLSGIGLDGFYQQVKWESSAAPTIVYFFADWCPVCRLQNPVINNLSGNNRVIGIAMNSGNVHQVGDYAQSHQLDFPVIIDPRSRISQTFGVNGVPSVFIVDAAGDIRYSLRGYTPELGLRARLLLSQ